MMKKMSKELVLLIIFTISFLGTILISFVPMEFDQQQYIVLDVFNPENGKYYDLSESAVAQLFTVEKDQITGFDILFSGQKHQFYWELSDQSSDLLRSGEKNNSGESRVTKIRFEPLTGYSGEKLTLKLYTETENSGLLIASNDGEYCNECEIIIDDENINGNFSIVPVYQADSIGEFLGLLRDRVLHSLSFYK